MTVYDANGTKLDKAGVLALTTLVTPQDPLRQVNALVTQTYTPRDTNSGFESSQRTVFVPGQKVPESAINALFKTATVSANGISPATGGTAGGTVVTITGTDLSGAKGVTFGGTAGTAFKVVSDKKIQVTTPAKAAGAVNVVVQDDSGDVTVANGFTYA